MAEPRRLERCCVCDDPTGRAGAGEDSIFCERCEVGPFCEECAKGHACVASKPMAKPTPADWQTAHAVNDMNHDDDALPGTPTLAMMAQASAEAHAAERIKYEEALVTVRFLHKQSAEERKAVAAFRVRAGKFHGAVCRDFRRIVDYLEAANRRLGICIHCGVRAPAMAVLPDHTPDCLLAADVARVEALIGKP